MRPVPPNGSRAGVDDEYHHGSSSPAPTQTAEHPFNPLPPPNLAKVTLALEYLDRLSRLGLRGADALPGDDEVPIFHLLSGRRDVLEALPEQAQVLVRHPADVLHPEGLREPPGFTMSGRHLNS